MHFLVKVILIDFQLKKYMQCKEKDDYIFACNINVTVTSQNGVPSFTRIKELICGGVITHLKILLFSMFVALKWLETSKETLK